MEQITVGEQIARRQALERAGAGLAEDSPVCPVPTEEDWASRPLNRAEAREFIRVGFSRAVRKHVFFGRVHRPRRRSQRQLAAVFGHASNLPPEAE